MRKPIVSQEIVDNFKGTGPEFSKKYGTRKDYLYGRRNYLKNGRVSKPTYSGLGKNFVYDQIVAHTKLLKDKTNLSFLTLPGTLNNFHFEKTLLEKFNPKSLDCFEKENYKFPNINRISFHKCDVNEHLKFVKNKYDLMFLDYCNGVPEIYWDDIVSALKIGGLIAITECPRIKHKIKPFQHKKMKQIYGFGENGKNRFTYKDTSPMNFAIFQKIK